MSRVVNTYVKMEVVLHNWIIENIGPTLKEGEGKKSRNPSIDPFSMPGFRRYLEGKEKLKTCR